MESPINRTVLLHFSNASNWIQITHPLAVGRDSNCKVLDDKAMGQPDVGTIYLLVPYNL